MRPSPRGQFRRAALHGLNIAALVASMLLLFTLSPA